jgi:hypothetical protein
MKTVEITGCIMACMECPVWFMRVSVTDSRADFAHQGHNCINSKKIEKEI